MGAVREFLSKSVEFIGEEIVPVARDLRKAGLLGPQGAYEPKASLIDPFSYNLTVFGYKEKYSFIDYAKARQISYSDPVLSAIIQTRTNQVGSFAVQQDDRYKVGFKISTRDKKRKPNGAAKKKADELSKFIMNCGFPEQLEDTPDVRKRDNFEMFLRKITRDSLTFDQVNFEVVPRLNGVPAQFIAVDAGTVRVLPDKRDLAATYGGMHGNTYHPPTANANALMPSLMLQPYSNDMNVHQTKVPRYTQLVNGTPRATFDEWEMAFGIRNPRTDILSNGYGFSEIEMLLTAITAHLNADTYNRKFFSQGSSQKGIISFEGNVPPDQLEAFRRQYHQQVSGVQNAWKTPIISTGHKDNKLNWVSLHSTNKEMEWGKYTEYLVKTICGVYQIDPIEIGFDIAKNSSGDGGSGSLGGQGQQIERLKFSKDKGLDPLLRFIANMINDYIIWRIDPDFEFEFVGLNAASEKEQVDLDKEKVQTFMSLDELRAEHDLPAVKRPEDVKSVGDMVLSQTYVQAFSAISMSGGEEGGGMPGEEGAEGQEPGAPMGDDDSPSYENMSDDDLSAELAKLQGKPGAAAKLQGKPGAAAKSMEAQIKNLEIIL